MDRLHSNSAQAETLAEFPAHELFAAARTAVLLADAQSGRVIAVNPAAQSLLGRPSAALVGNSWVAGFGLSAAPELHSAAARAVALGTAVRVLAATTGAASMVRATLSTFRIATLSYLLVRLDAADEIGGNHAAIPPGLFEQLDALSLGFVITDEALCVEYGNRAFLALTGEPALDTAEGQCLLRWLDLAQSDLDVMRRQLQLREAASILTARLNTRSRPGQTVEVVAIAVPDAASGPWGFVLRPAAKVAPRAADRSVN